MVTRLSKELDDEPPSSGGRWRAANLDRAVCSRLVMDMGTLPEEPLSVIWPQSMMLTFLP